MARLTCTSLGVPNAGRTTVAGDVRGLAVHTVARVISAAGPSDILAATTTTLLSSGAPFAFDERGRHELKGLPVPIDLYVVRQAS